MKPIEIVRAWFNSTAGNNIDHVTADAAGGFIERAAQEEEARRRTPILRTTASGMESKKAGDERGKELHAAAEQDYRKISAYYNHLCLVHPENSDKTNRGNTARHFGVSLMTVKRAIGLVK